MRGPPQSGFDAILSDRGLAPTEVGGDVPRLDGHGMAAWPGNVAAADAVAIGDEAR